MVYRSDLKTGQQIYLDNQGAQTIVTLASSSPGQQQQSSSSFQTGSWTKPPQIFATAAGALIKIYGAEAESWIQVQGSSIALSHPTGSLGEPMPMQSVEPLPTMQPIQPMQPMQPMQMGDMSMSMNPMQMRMGNLSMSMHPMQAGAAQHCSQCGTAVKPDDRFCSHCGNRLN